MKEIAVCFVFISLVYFYSHSDGIDRVLLEAEPGLSVILVKIGKRTFLKNVLTNIVKTTPTIQLILLVACRFLDISFSVF